MKSEYVFVLFSMIFKFVTTCKKPTLALYPVLCTFFLEYYDCQIICNVRNKSYVRVIHIIPHRRLWPKYETFKKFYFFC